MCQMNLDAYQGKISSKLGIKINMPVLFLTQLLGLAFGLPSEALLLDQNIVPMNGKLRQLQNA
jgi:heterodisulfide reductase subunit B